MCAFGVVGILMSQISVQTASAAAAIQIGHTVKVSAILRIRATPGLAGAILGHENIGTKGTVVDGPQTADNLTWMKVKYADNFVGWSTTDYLVDMGQNTQAPSQDGKYLTSSSGTLTDSFGNVWEISAAKTVIKNGNASEVPDFTSNVAFLLWYGNSLYYEAQNGGAVQWWNWNGQSWVQVADDPRPIGNRPGVPAGSAGGTTGGGATVTLTVAPSTISPGGSAIITWISSNATSCTGFNFTPAALSGVAIVHPSNTTAYAITCGSASAQGTLTVTR